MLKSVGRSITPVTPFAKAFPDREIVSTLSRQLPWSHFILICAIDDDLKRDFYAEMCRVQRWTVRALQQQLNGKTLLQPVAFWFF